MRCFIAIDMPKEVREIIKSVQKRIPEVNLKKVNPEKAHLTLKFLGELDRKKVDKVREKLEKVDFGSFKIKTGDIGVFSPSFIKVVWLGLESQDLINLKRIVEDELREIFQKDDKDFKPHVTLARVKNLKGMDRKEFIRRLNRIDIGEKEFIVDRIKLKKSELKKEGPEYTDIYVKEL